MSVPCNGCTACCRGPGRKHLRVKRVEERNFATVAINGYRHLRQSIDGTCEHVTERGCAIYDRRPAACREFDCREHLPHYLPHVDTAARMRA